MSLLTELGIILLGVFYNDFTPAGVGEGRETGKKLASQARPWMDAPIRIVRLRETWSGARSYANGEPA
jgi:hypothetical protein